MKKSDKMKLKLLLFIALCSGTHFAFAQTQDSLLTGDNYAGSAPIPIEGFSGDKGFAFQLIVSKQFSPKSKFGFFNVTNFVGDYHEINQSSEFVSQSFLTGEVWKGISLAVGLSAIGSSSSPLTVRPTAGIQYLLTKRNLVIVILPRFDLTQTHNFETFAMLEYKLMFSKNWGIYSRIQGVYNYNTDLEYHEVSNIYLRLGVSYKNVQFGLGTIHNFYGPDAYTVNNFGAFIKTDLF